MNTGIKRGFLVEAAAVQAGVLQDQLASSGHEIKL